MRVTLLEPICDDRALQKNGILQPAKYVEWMNDEMHAISRLANLMPAVYINGPFPGKPNKFDLLNGWRLPKLTKLGVRTAYKRARWFLTPGEARTLNFEIRPPKEMGFEIRFDNKIAYRSNVGPDWLKIDFPPNGLAPDRRFVVEINREKLDEDFDSCCIDVRNRHMAPRAFLDRLRSVLGL